jgi:hypothetical protein
MSKTTVIIPNYNGMKYIKDCIESLLVQTLPSDIIIIDNASTDGSVEFLKDNYDKELTCKDGTRILSRVVCLDSNTGFSNAVNKGIELAKTDYVFLLNNDTVCHKDCIEKLENTLNHKKKAFSVQALMVSLKNPNIVDDSGDYYSAIGWAFTDGKDKPADGFTKRKMITSSCAGAAIYRKNVFDIIGGFDVAHFCYLEDVDVGIRAKVFGYVNLLEPQAIVLHAGSATSGSRYNEFKQKFTAGNNIYLIYKNFPALMIILNLPLILLGIIIKAVFFAKKGLGKAYFQGLSQGFDKIFKNRDKKVRFKADNLKNYFNLQIELWVNTIKRFI